MAMNPRLLVPRATGYTPIDADARAYVTAVQLADGQRLEPKVSKAIDDFVLGCKSDGIWSAIKACCLLMGARTLAGINTPLVGSTPTFNAFVSGDYNRKTGLIGNGSTKYIDAARNNNADPQDSFHMAVYKSTLSTGTAVFMGSGVATVETGASNFGRTGSQMFSRNRCSSAQVRSLAAGFIGMNRSASASFVARSGGTNQTHTVTSETRHDAGICVFASTGASSNLSNGRCAFYSIGESLDLSLLDTRVTSLYNAIGAGIA